MIKVSPVLGRVMQHTPRVCRLDVIYLYKTESKSSGRILGMERETGLKFNNFYIKTIGD
jgi:hypothetical protein